MSIELITDFQRLCEIESKWERLSSSCISMSPTWLLSWWDCYCESTYSLRVYVAWEDEELVAILPLMLMQEDENTILHFMSNNCSDYLSVLSDSDVTFYINKILELILADDEWDILYLDNIEADDDNARRIVNKLIGAGYKVNLNKHDDIARIHLKKPWDAYLSEKTRNTRHAYLHIENYYEEQNFIFQVLRNYDETAVNEMIELHNKRWVSVNSPPPFSDERRMNFFHKVAQRFAAKGELVVFMLLSEQSIIAYRFGFIIDNRYYDWNTSYSLSYAQYSCGKILLKMVYEYCFNNSITTIDFMKGRERYKEELMTHASYLYSIQCVNQKVQLYYIPPKEKIRGLVSRVRGVIFDLDGVVYTGKTAIDDTINVISHLQTLNVKIGFLTNTSAKRICDIQRKLESMGVETGGCYFMTSAVATGRYMHEKAINSCVIYGGGESLLEEVQSYGTKVLCKQNSDFQTVPSAIVIGYTTDFDYSDFIFCVNLINRGAKLICTDKDSKFAYEGSWLPGTGWIVSALEYVTEKKALIMGKPETTSLEYIVEIMQENSDKLLMVGDNINTDIMAAKAMGISSCLLLGGISRRADVAKLPSRLRPEIIVDSLKEVNDYFMEV